MKQPQMPINEWVRYIGQLATEAGIENEYLFKTTLECAEYVKVLSRKNPTLAGILEEWVDYIEYQCERKRLDAEKKWFNLGEWARYIEVMSDMFSLSDEEFRKANEPQEIVLTPEAWRDHVLFCLENLARSDEAFERIIRKGLLDPNTPPYKKMYLHGMLSVLRKTRNCFAGLQPFSDRNDNLTKFLEAHGIKDI